MVSIKIELSKISGIFYKMIGCNDLIAICDFYCSEFCDDIPGAIVKQLNKKGSKVSKNGIIAVFFDENIKYMLNINISPGKQSTDKVCSVALRSSKNIVVMKIKTKLYCFDGDNSVEYATKKIKSKYYVEDMLKYGNKYLQSHASETLAHFLGSVYSVHEIICENNDPLVNNTTTECTTCTKYLTYLEQINAKIDILNTAVQTANENITLMKKKLDAL